MNFVGNDKRTDRNTIYDMMLSNMSDAQLLNIQVIVSFFEFLCLYYFL